MPSHHLCVGVLHKLDDLESIKLHISLFPTKIRKCASLTFFPVSSSFSPMFLACLWTLSLSTFPLLKRGCCDGKITLGSPCFDSQIRILDPEIAQLTQGNNGFFFPPAFKDSTGKKYFTVLGSYGKLTKKSTPRPQLNVLKINGRPESSIFCSKLWLNKKEWNNTIYSNMDGPSEASQIKRNIVWYHLFVELKKNDTE